MSNSPTMLDIIKRMRNVEESCPDCNGMGNKAYSSGATWRGGMGTASLAWDTCDVCWGSGDANIKYTDIRKLEGHRIAWEKDQCKKWLALSLAANFKQINSRLKDLSAHCHKQANKRKLPAGMDPQWWNQSWFALGNILGRLGDE